MTNGNIAWQRTNTKGAFFDYTHDGVDTHNVYFAGDDSVIYIYNKSSDAYVGDIPLQSYARAITPKGNALFVSQAWKPDSAETAYGRIIRLNSQTHKMQWQYTAQNGGFYQADLIVKDGLVYSGAVGPGEFVALDAQTGHVKWKQKGLRAYWFTLANDNLYIDNGTGIVALDAQT